MYYINPLNHQWQLTPSEILISKTRNTFFQTPVLLTYALLYAMVLIKTSVIAMNFVTFTRSFSVLQNERILLAQINKYYHGYQYATCTSAEPDFGESSTNVLQMLKDFLIISIMTTASVCLHLLMLVLFVGMSGRDFMNYIIQYYI